MSWKKIAIILAVIAVIHIVVILWILPDKTPDKKTVVPAVPAEVQKTPAEKKAPEIPEQQPEKPPQPQIAGKVSPWDYSKRKNLPASLNKRAQRARSGILVDLDRREVLWAKDSRRPVAVASLTKLMTALLVAEKMHCDPDFKWTTTIRVSKAATSVERSCVLGLQENEIYALGELMQSMMINSHNDSAAQIAAEVSGSVPEFVQAMNKRGKELGLASVSFNSPNGLPQGKKRVNSFASVEDITYICENLIPYDRVMELCRKRSAQLHTGKWVYSHNNLLLEPTKRRPNRKPVPGLIGFKTGFTNAAGFCLAFGVKRDEKTVLGCVTGFPSAMERDIFCREIIEWAYRTKQTKQSKQKKN